MILWHGEAGTGTTFALRALAWEWWEWCRFHYIVDPDSFFGEHADYLISVLLQPAVPMMLRQGGFRGFVSYDFDAGQGLSRFLNVVDGLIGQGLRVLELVTTTNEPIRKLHPAVARPGRCAANIEFGPLGKDEASSWREQHGLDGEVSASCTLTSLYAQLEGRDPSEAVLIGFGD